ncbi:RIP metalloprotease RseP [Dissulfurimicrobium hydrothermale]|uniref:RIP metalloprotease RseP n=1 Tax=Dissulfurimicrobium hydrothermale TaxID=1750598 RepID=UPI001ED9E0FB|nr:RIP metalloprotease RseP [Dissulfurimicrobium hydrothermale]UKL14381.1 RIP metalloprotease RseP [Dissulfurimicrobium hydrothermale]
MTTVWSFLLVLSLLILVHEFGHFIVARRLGIKVLKFSFGFGPRLFGIIRGATDYCVSALPLGGFVKMLGEQPDEPVPDNEIKGSFSHRPVWQRAAIVFAGPLFNIIFAWAIFFVIFLSYGNPILLPDIGNVQAGSPAQKAGITKKDKIIAINGQPVKTWQEVSERIKKYPGHEISISIKRGEKLLDLIVKPNITRLKNIFGEEVKVPVIGISAAGDLKIEKLNPLEALAQASVKTWELTVLTAKGFLKIIQRAIPLSTLGGPIMIAQLAGEQAQLGLLNLFYFIAILSINLGLLNLLPIPVLDGGHLAFFTLEAIIGRPLSIKQMEFAQKIGMAILGTLMLFVFYNDIIRLLGIAHTVTTTP